MRAPWPHWPGEIGHCAVAGLLVHAVSLGGVFVGIALGVEAGLAALIVGLQSLLVAAFAGLMLGERVSPRQWLGLVLGLAAVVAQKLGRGVGEELGALACVVSLFGLTAGTINQKRYGTSMDLRTGMAVQFTAAGVVTAPFALFFEWPRQVERRVRVRAALARVRTIDRRSVAALCVDPQWSCCFGFEPIFSYPPCTALMVWPLFGETLGLAALSGMVLTVAGVTLATRSA